MNYPDTDRYRALYAKYLKRPASAFLNLYNGDLKGKTVWDFCAGGGEISLACLEAGAAKVVAVEKSNNMLRRLRLSCPDGLDIKRSSIEYFLMEQYNLQSPDVIFCRQGVNYWLSDSTMELLRRVMQPGSQFIFNTFNTKPSERPTVKTYDYEGYSFAEVSWLVGEMVYHSQARNGMEPHSTQFKWIPKEEFLRILGEGYAIDIVEDGHTSLYRCTRK